ncbi:MAG: RNase adapter RapZ [Gammaproteobacteria bacterium]
MRLIIVSGLSGSGKSIAIQALEDLEFYCVDNLPVALLPQFANKMLEAAKNRGTDSVAVGIDARNLVDELRNLKGITEEIRKEGIVCEVLFLEADEKTLLQRFSSTRRKHPLSTTERHLYQAIADEKKLLQPMMVNADLIIDTSRLNVHQLRSQISERVAKRQNPLLSLLFISFGFKNGTPVDADYIFDVRCLPNPYWYPELRGYTGKDEEIIEFLQNQPLVSKMFEDISSFLKTWIPSFEAENRSYMTIGIGCTGGQHRSVYLTEQLAKNFMESDKKILITHRDIA